ncbi:endonuclease/exonuclease/phosphatase [Niabella ginsenosidivorans]|uniref:Endonuclease/exonuclease/phosphatase n=1 Tax=Niabella ginsenosidivorans TaxID=1176587 RepID=A0A1A9I7Y2_9BACT|nr:endonuclease/exonuclease/phosphatase [Niabella ginsenosidivorans]ANH83435.1 endonuclease/exonuclease/phosphatase [Niabella ginsenosidivorans]
MKKIPVYFITLLFCFCSKHAITQQGRYQSAIIAFYNLENFYDTIFYGKNDDETFTPNGTKAYTGAVFNDKVLHQATVMAQIGTELNPDGAALLGVAEVENDAVLDTLIRHPLIAGRHYQYVHYDSWDARGIDVALIYNPKYFKVLKSRPLYVKLPEGAKESLYTRDILWVTGLLDGERVHLFINHWPSRYGGAKKSEPGRMAAAATVRKFIDTLISHDPMAKIIVMGDLNDDPVNNSVVKGIKATADSTNISMGMLYNPWVGLYKKGQGSLAYQNAWSLFDQILLSEGFLDKQQSGFFFYRNAIFKKDFMVENTGPYKGYPMRFYGGDVYRGGYSDHFPVYIILLKKVL